MQNRMRSASEWETSFEAPTTCNLGQRCHQPGAASAAHHYVVILEVCAGVLVVLALAGIAMKPTEPRDVRRKPRVMLGVVGSLLVSVPVVLAAGGGMVWMLLAVSSAAAVFTVLALALFLATVLSGLLSNMWSDRSRRSCAVVGFVTSSALVIVAAGAFWARLGASRILAMVFVVEVVVLLLAAALTDPGQAATDPGSADND